MSSLQRRLPGVRFEVPPPALREALPRMDIALFVGFTAAGPVDLPVAVESLGEFESVFGGEILLAREAATGDDVRGLLHPCVRGFFSDGGRRCWIVRVAAASARTTVFPLANLLLARRADPGEAWHFEPAYIAARSPGSWADGLGVATRINVQPVQVRPVGGYADAQLSVDVLGPPALALRTGELLRFAGEGESLVHARIAEIDAPVSEPGGRLRRRVRLRGLCGLGAVVRASPFPTVSQLEYFEPSSDGDTLVERRVTAQGEWEDGDGRVILRCRLPAGRVPGIGTVLRISFADSTDTAWFTVAEIALTQTGEADGNVGVQLSGRIWNADSSDWRSRLDAWIGDGRERSVQWLRLDLRVREGGEPDFTLAQIGMAAPVDAQSAGLGIASLPDDQHFFSTDGEGTAGSPVALAFELTRRDTFGHLTRRFPLASLPASLAAGGELMLIPLGNEQEFGPGLGAGGIDRPPLERDGLDAFSWGLFAEPLLAEHSIATLADQAEALRFLDRKLRPLRGMHAAFGSSNTAVVDEPTLLAIPDAVHSGWQPVANAQPAWAELPPPAPAEAPACDCDFIACAMTPLPSPRFVRGADPDAEGSFTLQWTQPESVALPVTLYYELQEASDATFAAATLSYSGSAQRFSIIGKKAGTQFYRVRASLGARRSPWSQAVAVHVQASGYETRPWQPDDLLAIHRLMLRTAAGRGDLLAVLGLPRHYRCSDAVAHASALRDADAVTSGPVAPRPIGDDEVRALSHGALYHPWLLTQRVDSVIASPPDGAVCGQLAAGAIDRGAWAAVANQPLHDVVALTAAATRDDLQNCLDAQVNLVRSSPQGFVLATADTLTPDADWRPINVRRLLTLLRRLALRRGATYVFEPNGATLRRTVERGFEAVLDELFRRGALAGANAQAAYRVEVGDEINTPHRNDLGQFWVELKVAPALPLTFLTVRLARSGERLVARETR